MKFLCVPCDTPMKLQSVGPPDRGSLSGRAAAPGRSRIDHARRGRRVARAAVW
jgi:hypothetical protein